MGRPGGRRSVRHLGLPAVALARRDPRAEATPGRQKEAPETGAQVPNRHHCTKTQLRVQPGKNVSYAVLPPGLKYRMPNVWLSESLTSPPRTSNGEGQGDAPLQTMG